MGKSVFASRTIWVNVLVLVASLLAVAIGDAWVSEYPQAVSVLVAIQSAVNLVLRFLTVEPVFIPGGDKINRE